MTHKGWYAVKQNSNLTMCHINLFYLIFFFSLSQDAQKFKEKFEEARKIVAKSSSDDESKYPSWQCNIILFYNFNMTFWAVASIWWLKSCLTNL